jgi:hypothetical protein
MEKEFKLNDEIIKRLEEIGDLINQIEEILEEQIKQQDNGKD